MPEMTRFTTMVTKELDRQVKTGEFAQNIRALRAGGKSNKPEENQ